jgi:UDP-N-acetylglucosamine 4,6-dehydratase/5-epimerase
MLGDLTDRNSIKGEYMKKVLIFGGSGTFGTAMTKRLLNEVDTIIHYDRDEKNQYNSKQLIKDKKVIRIIGDIRDKEAVDNAIKTYQPDTIMLASAMKHIDKCELYPNECKKTNIDGCINVINSAIENNIEKLVFLSTDKATNPTTIYGCSKLFVEMYIQAVDSKNTKIITTRYGNVLGSNGSVLDIWRRQRDNNEPLTITNPQMTRFFMTIDQAIDLVLYCLKNGSSKDLWVYNNKACTIQELASCISDNQVETGLRCEEKNDEALLTTNELEHSLLHDLYYQVNKDIKSEFKYDKPLRSDNAERFTKEELLKII